MAQHSNLYGLEWGRVSESSPINENMHVHGISLGLERTHHVAIQRERRYSRIDIAEDGSPGLTIVTTCTLAFFLPGDRS